MRSWFKSSKTKQITQSIPQLNVAGAVTVSVADPNLHLKCPTPLGSSFSPERHLGYLKKWNLGQVQAFSETGRNNIKAQEGADRSSSCQHVSPGAKQSHCLPEIFVLQVCQKASLQLGFDPVSVSESVHQ